MRHLLSCFFCTAATLLTGLAAHAQVEPPLPGSDGIARLTVRGSVELEKPADRLRLQIGVVTEHADPKTALADNSRKMDLVVRAIRKVGLDTDEYETGRFSIQPLYSHRPRGADATWRPRIEAYRVTNTILVKTKKLDKAGELIQAAAEAGANATDSIIFDLSDRRAHRAEAIRAATAAARSDAAVLAEAAGVELVRILSINLDPDAYRPVGYGMGGAMRAEAAVASPPPITPGDVTVRASVTVVYQIAHREHQREQ